MPAPLAASPLVPTLLPQVVPLLFLVGAVCAGRATHPPAPAWRLARATTVAALVAAAINTAIAAATVGGWPAARAAVLLLIAFVGHVLTRFAGTYLDGEPRQPHFVRWLLGTLAGSSMVVATGHFAWLVLAWLGTSLALQQLLTFYPERPAARMAAHKKFLVSRAADVCMVAAGTLLWLRFDTLQLDALGAAVAAGAELGTAGRVAVVLIVAATLLKSAQLPFHGWLMQVMEAPTPVSALLHAGVVNLGGFVLIRLQGLVAAVPTAQVLLVVVGSLTAVLAAAIASTRISIKVALAWSTCAQMGFMVLQCGLGLYEMALLHLLAHSLYKANAFLAAGSTPQVATVAALAPRAAPATTSAHFAALAVAMLAVIAVGRAFGIAPTGQPAVAAMAFVVAAAVATLLLDRARAHAASSWLPRLAAVVGVVVAWFALHHVMHGWLGADGTASAATGPLAVWTATCFLLLFAVQTLAATRPTHPSVQRLRTWCFGGLHLDEWFTRLTLRMWPDGPAAVPIATPRPTSPRSR